ncbi:MAG: MATE family efflux transporter [Eubacteriales bacterium]
MLRKEYLAQIWRIAIPLLIENTLQTLLGTVDRYFASSIDDSAIAAIGVTEIVTNLYLAFFISVNVGISVVIGQNIGKNDMEQVRESVRQGMMLSILLGLLIGLVSLLFGRKILLFTGCIEEILNFANPYFMAVTVPSVFLSLSLTLSACLRGAKDTKTPMLFTSICNILNIFLNIIFLKLGFGMFGIGLATSISRLFLRIGLLVAIRRKKGGFSIKKYRINMPVLKEIATIGLPAGGEKLAMRLGQLGYTAMLLSLGTEAYVSHTLAATIENYIYIPIFAFSTTTSILVSISLG